MERKERTTTTRPKRKPTAHTRRAKKRFSRVKPLARKNVEMRQFQRDYLEPIQNDSKQHRKNTDAVVKYCREATNRLSLSAMLINLDPKESSNAKRWMGWWIKGPNGKRMGILILREYPFLFKNQVIMELKLVCTDGSYPGMGYRAIKFAEWFAATQKQSPILILDSVEERESYYKRMNYQPFSPEKHGPTAWQERNLFIPGVVGMLMNDRYANWMFKSLPPHKDWSFQKYFEQVEQAKARAQERWRKLRKTVHHPPLRAK